VTTGDRYAGALLGLAAGDALGTTLEFRAPGTFEDIVGGGPFGPRSVSVPFAAPPRSPVFAASSSRAGTGSASLAEASRRSDNDALAS